MSDWFDGGSGSPVDVAAVLDGTGITEALASIVQDGALVSIGTTSDGGSLGLTVTLDGRWKRCYGREAHEFTEFLAGAAVAVEAAAGSRPASPGGGQRSRRSRSR